MEIKTQLWTETIDKCTNQHILTFHLELENLYTSQGQDKHVKAYTTLKLERKLFIRQL